MTRRLLTRGLRPRRMPRRRTPPRRMASRPRADRVPRDGRGTGPSPGDGRWDWGRSMPGWRKRTPRPRMRCFLGGAYSRSGVLPGPARSRLRRRRVLRVGPPAGTPHRPAGRGGGAGPGAPAGRPSRADRRGPDRCRRARARPGSPRRCASYALVSGRSGGAAPAGRDTATRCPGRPDRASSSRVRRPLRRVEPPVLLPGLRRPGRSRPAAAARHARLPPPARHRGDERGGRAAAR